eukprot:713166-Alexandrium_andersonii.AAC.1
MLVRSVITIHNAVQPWTFLADCATALKPSLKMCSVASTSEPSPALRSSADTAAPSTAGGDARARLRGNARSASDVITTWH